MKKQEKQELKKEIKEINKQLEEYEYYNNKISEIFDSKIVEQAKKEFNRVYNQLDFLPEEIAKFIKNLKKDMVLKFQDKPYNTMNLENRKNTCVKKKKN